MAATLHAVPRHGLCHAASGITVYHGRALGAPHGGVSKTVAELNLYNLEVQVALG